MSLSFDDELVKSVYYEILLKTDNFTNLEPTVIYQLQEDEEWTHVHSGLLAAKINQVLLDRNSASVGLHVNIDNYTGILEIQLMPMPNLLS